MKTPKPVDRARAKMFGPVIVYHRGGGCRVTDPDAVIAEDGQTVILTDPADDPAWWVSFCLPIASAYDGDTAVVRVAPDFAQIEVRRSPGARADTFPIPAPVRCDLIRHGLIAAENGT